MVPHLCSDLIHGDRQWRQGADLTAHIQIEKSNGRNPVRQLRDDASCFKAYAS